VQTGDRGAEGPDDRTLVDFAVVPHDDHATAEMPEELAEERADRRSLEVVVVQLEVEAEALTPGAHRKGGDGRDPVVPLPAAQEGGLTPGRLGAAHAGDEQKAGLVYEDEGGPQPCGVFFTRGQASCFHRAMAASLRWRARRSGFCTDQSSAWRRRPT